MFFEGFEGYKKIHNSTNLSINQIHDLLMKYEKEIGSIAINQDVENAIIIDIPSKYIIDIYLDGSYIIIERRLEEGELKDYENPFEQGKDLIVAQADRMIEQIYDLLNDYINNNGAVSEHVTSVKKELFMEEEKRLVLGGSFSLGNVFYIKDKNGNNLYEAKQSYISQLYIIKNIITKLEEFSLKYDKINENKFMILKQPFDKIDIFKDEESIKTVFKGNGLKKELKISADYTDNHFLIELNEIVIGAIDCLNPLEKSRYKIEINDEKQESLIVAIAVMLDVYNLKNNNELGLQ